MAENIKVKIRCVLCKEIAELNEEQAKITGAIIEVYEIPMHEYVDGYLDIISDLFEKGRCSVGEDKQHIWLFHEDTTDKIDILSGTIANKSHNVVILEGKVKGNDNALIRIEDEEKKLGDEKKRIKQEIETDKNEISKNIADVEIAKDKLRQFLHIKNIESFLIERPGS